jgi:metal-dependent HD superfamily phosphatase/phosphodiesterase
MKRAAMDKTKTNIKNHEAETRAADGETSGDGAEATASGAATGISLDDVKADPGVRSYMERADRHLGVIGYTEHGDRHAGLVAKIAYNILKHLGRSQRDAELASIAGYLHDLGNLVNRKYEAQSGALIAESILNRMGMPFDEISEVVAAIGNHHEESGDAVSDVAAALILADKSDVHRTRVRNPDMIKFDIHDRVNYAARNSFLRVHENKKAISLELTIDTEISQMMEYFEIFLSRMIACKRAAEHLGCSFGLAINGNKML